MSRVPTGDESTLRLRVRQAPRLAERALRRPRWFAANLRMFTRRRLERRRGFVDPGSRTDLLVGLEEAVAEVLEVPLADVRAADARFRAGAPGDGAMTWDARPTLQRLVNVVVRLHRPAVMVETGVARGVSSAIALAAMDDLGHGRLYSVDLPALSVDPATFVGSAVPPALRERWELLLGPSEDVLPPLLERLGQIDAIVHDADHTYPSQLREYRQAWPHLRPGGVLMADDVFNDAFADFAAEAGVRAVLVDTRDDAGVPGALGILRKPAAG